CHGIDDVILNSPIKIRQQVYTVLSARGFKADNTTRKHPFIDSVKDNILEILDAYRIIALDDIKQELEEAVAQVIRQIVTIFYIRLQAQDPIGDYVWIECGEELDPLSMIYPEID